MKNTRKRHTYDEIVNAAEERGWKVVSKEYESLDKKMRFICPKGHERDIIVGSFLRYFACGVCSGIVVDKKEKYDMMVSIAKTKGWEILSTEYKNNITKMKFLCPNGHERDISAVSWLKEFPCGICSRTQVNKVEEYKKLTLAAENRGWKVLFSEYVNSTQKMSYACGRGHVQDLDTWDFYRKDTCFLCENEDKKKAKYDEIVAVANEKGWKVVSKEYVSVNFNMEFMCPNEHIRSINPKRFLDGQGCTKCSGHDPDKTARFNDISKMAHDKGWVVLSEKYEGINYKMRFACSKGHVVDIVTSSFLKGCGCVECFDYTRRGAEKRFVERVEHQGGKVVGSYSGNHAKVECICRNGHVCFTSPRLIGCGFNLCSQCDGAISSIERITQEILEELGFDIRFQITPSGMKRLKFDFEIKIGNDIVYIESDGRQHQMFNAHFHKSQQHFESARQRDLVKNYFARHTNNVRLIRLHHKLFTCKKKAFVYVSDALKSADRIVCDTSVYTWIDDVPDEKYVRRYLT